MANDSPGLWTKLKTYFKFEGWQGAVDFFDALAHAANFMGVGVHLAGQYLPVIELLFGPIARVADPLIYCFRAIERIIRYVGRNKFGIKFEEEKYGPPHPKQDNADIIVTAMFILAIVFFAFHTTPFLLSAAWFLGIAGVSISGYFDHRYPENLAREKYLANTDTTQDETIFEDYLKKYYSTRLYYGLMLSLVLLLILGSATGFGLPLAMDAALKFTAQVGGVLVVLINAARPISKFHPHLLHQFLPGPERRKDDVAQAVLPKTTEKLESKPPESTPPTVHPSPIGWCWRRSTAGDKKEERATCWSCLPSLPFSFQRRS
jgi:hypothetical protein